VKRLSHTAYFVAPVLAALLLAGCGSDGGPTAVTTSLDSTPPQAPTGLVQTTGSGGSPVLRWTPNAEADLDGYEVYKYSPAPDRDNAYVMVGSVDGTPEYPLTGIGTSWYRVRALDRSGNRSAASSALTVSLQGGGSAPSPSAPEDDNPLFNRR
jgi:hypothetical protein